MIEPAVALAEARGWSYDILSPLQLALVVPSLRPRAFYPMHIFCSVDGKAWGFILNHEFLVESDRSEFVHDTLLRLEKFFAPAELDLRPKPECSIRYARELEIDKDVPGHLGCAIDEALVDLNFALDVLRLVNWGGKSAEEAITFVSIPERHHVRLEQAIKTKITRSIHGTDAE